MMIDTSWDSNGMLIAPDDYLVRSAAIVRAAGGLVIADEVQAGYCRLGDTWWGHERSDYFNTLGGNPVSAAVALSVIDIIDDEGLLENARQVGTHLPVGLEELARNHEIIGNVQGSGLFWGRDLVTDRSSRQPITPTDSKRLVTALSRDGALMGVTGRHGNLVKIRPPLPFGRDHANHALEVLDGCLRAMSPA
jgi:4-aminobutyrate aminotransferase-like enzyme